jgi:hypothetical protein
VSLEIVAGISSGEQVIADSRQPAESSLAVAAEAFVEALNAAERRRRRLLLGERGETLAQLIDFIESMRAICADWGTDSLLEAELQTAVAESQKLASEQQVRLPDAILAPAPELGAPTLNEQGLRESNFNAWREWYNHDSQVGEQVERYGDTITYRLAAGFLDGLDIQDWGCGYAWFKQFVENGKYTGVDGTRTRWSDIHADLAKFRSSTPGLHMRHVIEHNVHWQDVLDNALASFTKRMVLTLFTPFAEETHVITSTAFNVPDTSFKLSEVTDRFVNCTWRMETHHTNTQYGVEHIFFLER